MIPPEFVTYDRRPQQNFDYRRSRLNCEIGSWERMFENIWSREAIQQLWPLVSTSESTSPCLTAGYKQIVRDEPFRRQKFFMHIEGQTRHFSNDGAFSDSPEMESRLSDLFTLCAARGIHVDVVIPPSHAYYWQTLEEQDWGRRIETGKRCLTQIIAAANTKQVESHSRGSIRLWDFVTEEELASESLPEENSTTLMTWHFDSVHFRPRLGDMVINTITEPTDLNTGFGVQITPENLESHLENVRQQLQRNPERSPRPIQIANRTRSTHRP